MKQNWKTSKTQPNSKP